MGTYGEFFAFIPSTSAGTYGVATTQSTGSFRTFDARYLRIQNQATGQMRIVDVQVWAASPRANGTTARVLLGGTSPSSGIVSGGTLFSQLTNDLIDVDVMQMLGRQVWSGQVQLNNTKQRYSRATFPEGTPVKIWIDGNTVLLGTVTNFDPKFTARGLTANIEVRGYDDFLNQDIHYAWAASPISDQTQANDILSTGPNSVLGQTLNSVGTRVIGNLNTLNAQLGPNIVVYYKAKDIPKFQVLNDLAETAMDGAWILQNTNFSPTLATYGTSLGRSGSGVSDGYWFGVTTRPGYTIDLRTPEVANGVSLFSGSAIKSGTISIPDTNPAFGWDGNLGNDSLYNYTEVFQSVFFPISATSVAGSIQFTTAFGVQINSTTGGVGVWANAGNQVDELIVEGEDKIGRIKRLHYIVKAFITYKSTGPSCATGSNPQANFNYSGGNAVYPPPDTDVDKYIDLSGQTGGTCGWDSTSNQFTGTTARNLHTDWITKFDVAGLSSSSNSDVVTVIRIRQYPFVRPLINPSGEPNQSIVSTDWSNVKITPVAHIKTPPVRYDFYVTESSVGSQVADLFFFPRPRPNIDLSYRNLSGVNNIRWYVNPATSPVSSLGSDFNNVETFDFMKGDVYRVKNDTTTYGGQAVAVTDKATIDATALFYNARVAGRDTHSSKQEQINLADMASITSIGRRQKFFTLTQTDPVELVRETVKLAYQNRLTESRGTIKTRGNSALVPGYIITVESDYSELAGKYLIHQAQHKWNSNGYMTTINVEDIDFLMTNEFARAQASIWQAAGQGGRGSSTSGNLKSAEFTKLNVDPTGTTQANLTQGGNGVFLITKGSDTPPTASAGMDYSVFALPLNTVPEFSNVRFVTATISQMIGAENRGNAGTFGPSGGFHSGNVNDVLAQQEDSTGWATMSQSEALQTIVAGEQNMGTPSSYIAQRFLCTVSTGSFLFVFRGRMPTGSGSSFGGDGIMEFSIWNDSNIATIPTPGDPMVGAQGDVTFGWTVWQNYIAPGGIYKIAGQQYAAPTGWIEVPTNKITHTGPNSPTITSNAVAVEIKMQQPVNPGTNLWFVMRVQSAGGTANPVSPWIQYSSNSGPYLYPAELSDTAGRGTTAIDRWKTLFGVGNALNAFKLTNFHVYGLAPINSFGAYQPTNAAVQVHYPGTVGITSAAQNQSLLNVPVITDKNGSRMDVASAARISYPGQGAQAGNQVYSVEPVTGQAFAAISLPGQDMTISQISFPTSFVARRDGFGDVYVAVPLSVGTGTGQAGTGASNFMFRRVNYTLKADFNEF